MAAYAPLDLSVVATACQVAKLDALLLQEREDHLRLREAVQDFLLAYHACRRNLQDPVRTWFMDAEYKTLEQAVAPKEKTMQPVRPGDRVGVILNGDARTSTLRILGFGVYEGEAVPGPSCRGLVVDMLRDLQRPTAFIRLDNGQVVFGCEGFWDHEAKIVAQTAQHKRVITEDIEEVRRSYLVPGEPVT